MQRRLFLVEDFVLAIDSVGFGLGEFMGEFM